MWVRLQILSNECIYCDISWIHNLTLFGFVVITSISRSSSAWDSGACAIAATAVSRVVVWFLRLLRPPASRSGLEPRVWKLYGPPNFVCRNLIAAVFVAAVANAFFVSVSV